MKRSFIVLVCIVAGVAGLALYRGWFGVAADNADGKRSVTVTVDKDKIEQDKDKAVQKVQGLGQQAKDKAAATTQKVK